MQKVTPLSKGAAMADNTPAATTSYSISQLQEAGCLARNGLCGEDTSAHTPKSHSSVAKGSSMNVVVCGCRLTAVP